jgi:hypothetical protein
METPYHLTPPMDFNPFNIKTDEQRTFYWKSFERVRSEYLVWARGVFTRALAAGYRSWVVRFDEVTQPNEMTRYTIDPAPMAQAYNAVYRRVGGDFAVQTFKQIKSGGSGYITKDYTVNDFREMMQAWLLSVGAERVTSVNANTDKQIQAILQRILTDATNNGLSIEQTRKLITAEFKQLTGFRAERIARTEIVAASNHGALLAAESTGLQLQKVWIATRDDRTRDAHMNADGQTRNMGEPFNVDFVDMEMPGDPTAPASTVINCRCAVAFSRL